MFQLAWHWPTEARKPRSLLSESMPSQLDLASSSAAKTLRSRLTSGIFGRGALTFLIATAGLSISNFAFHIVVSRLIGPAQYGALGAILSIINLLAVPIGAIQIAATQAVISHSSADGSHSVHRMVKRVALAGAVGSAVLLLSTPLLDGFLHLTSSISLVVVAIWIPFAVVGAVLQGSLIGEYRFSPVAFATFVGGGLLRLGLGAALALLGFGVTGAIMATLAAQVFTTLSLAFSTRHQVLSSHRGASLSTSSRDIVVSLLALAGITVLTNMDTFLSRHYFKPVLAGQYAAGAIAAHIALFIPAAIVAISFPHLADGKGISDSSRKAFMQALKFMSALGIVVAVVMALLPSLIVTILFGSKFGPAAAIIRPLAFESAILGVLTLLLYLHLARRSHAAMVPWFGVALVAVITSLRHHSPFEIAIVMLVVTLTTLIAGAIPAWRALTTAAGREDTDPFDEINLPQVEVDLTLVVPFYNPGPSLGRHVAECVEVLTSTELSFEILAVSDGSTDHSEEQLADLDPQAVRVLRFDENQGKGAALRIGLLEGRGRYLGFIDSDGDLSPNLLNEFAKVINDEGPDIALGSKRHPESKVVYPPLRRIYSFGYQKLIRTLFHLPLQDTQTGIKMIRRDVLLTVLPRMVEKKFAFDLELFVVAKKMGYDNFVELPVVIGQRFTSTVSIKSARETLLDTLAIFYRLKVLRYYDRSSRTTLKESEHFGPFVGEGHVSREGIEASVDLVAKKPLRILILNWRDVSHPNAGGAEVYTHSVAQCWIEQGHNVTLFCARIHGRPQFEHVDGLNIIRRGSRYSVYRDARKYYLREGRGRYDLVVDEINTRPFLAPRWVDDVPVVGLAFQVCRELWRYQMYLPLALIGRYILEPMWLRQYHSAMVVTISESSKESLLQYGMKHVHIVPVGGETVLPDVSSPRESRPTVIFVGRLEAHKRPDEAIRAFKVLRDEFPDSIMWIIGSGPMQPQLRKSSPAGVQFLGQVSDTEKMDRLQRAHVVVATSVREGWGLVVTEAAALGTPTIAYNVPGLRDSVTASGGVLVSPNPKDLGRALCEYFKALPETGLPSVTPGGVIPWSQVADQILLIALTEAPGRM
jgi:glycosyltransferase involved in cell wall biosynthesis/O-antigen/teichoic acid export membrane protein